MIRKRTKVLCIGSEEAFTLRSDCRTRITMYRGIVSHRGVTEVIPSEDFKRELRVLVYKKEVLKAWLGSISTSEPHKLDDLEGYLLLAWREEGTPTVNYLVTTAQDGYYEGMTCHFKLKNFWKKSEKILNILRTSADLVDIELPEDEVRRVLSTHEGIEEHKVFLEAAEVEKD